MHATVYAVARFRSILFVILCVGLVAPAHADPTGIVHNAVVGVGSPPAQAIRYSIGGIGLLNLWAAVHSPLAARHLRSDLARARETDGPS